MTEKTQPTDAELMPCPFCEGRARMKTVASDWWKIIIDHAEGCVLSGHYDDAIVPQDDESKDWLIDRWNTRAKWGTPAPVGVEPQCWCLTCRPMRFEDPYSIRMALCPTCGNKRCPKANDHRNTCTGSNEPGQPGSAYFGGIKGGQHDI